MDISIFSSDLVVYLEDAKELIDIFTKLDNAPINKVLVRIPKPNSSSFEFILEKFHKLKNSEYIMKKLKKCCESIKLEETCVIPYPTTKLRMEVDSFTLDKKIEDITMLVKLKLGQYSNVSRLPSLEKIDGCLKIRVSPEVSIFVTKTGIMTTNYQDSPPSQIFSFVENNKCYDEKWQKRLYTFVEKAILPLLKTV